MTSPFNSSTRFGRELGDRRAGIGGVEAADRTSRRRSKQRNDRALTPIGRGGATTPSSAATSADAVRQRRDAGGHSPDARATRRARERLDVARAEAQVRPPRWRLPAPRHVDPAVDPPPGACCSATRPARCSWELTPPAPILAALPGTVRRAALDLARRRSDVARRGADRQTTARRRRHRGSVPALHLTVRPACRAFRRATLRRCQQVWLVRAADPVADLPGRTHRREHPRAGGARAAGR